MLYYFKFSSRSKNTSGDQLTSGKILAIFDWIKPFLVPNYFRI